MLEVVFFFFFNSITTFTPFQIFLVGSGGCSISEFAFILAVSLYGSLSNYFLVAIPLLPPPFGAGWNTRGSPLHWTPESPSFGMPWTRQKILFFVSFPGAGHSPPSRIFFPSKVAGLPSRPPFS